MIYLLLTLTFVIITILGISISIVAMVRLIITRYKLPVYEFLLYIILLPCITMVHIVLLVINKLFYY
jgi:hypothetical protein